jgi:hypothetical protein
MTDVGREGSGWKELKMVPRLNNLESWVMFLVEVSQTGAGNGR